MVISVSPYQSSPGNQSTWHFYNLRLMWTPLSVPCQMSEWESFIRFQTETEAIDYSITLDEIELNNKFDCWKMVSQKTLGNQTIKAWNNWSSLFQTHLHHINWRQVLKCAEFEILHNIICTIHVIKCHWLFLDRIAICLQLIKWGDWNSLKLKEAKVNFTKRFSWTN